MDPSMILASRPTPAGTEKADIDAFYETHGFDAASPIRRLRALVETARQALGRREEFVLRHPAE